jgi:arylsulfatase
VSQKKNQTNWAAEDKQIDQKLGALEQRFGKKPNIIFILADDVGWGEMGWQGGGKHRGTPTALVHAVSYRHQHWASSRAHRIAECIVARPRGGTITK